MSKLAILFAALFVLFSLMAGEAVVRHRLPLSKAATGIVVALWAFLGFSGAAAGVGWLAMTLAGLH